MDYSLLTPYIIPPQKKKAVNAGDGFIYDSAQKLIGKEAKHRFSTWAPLSDEDIEKINGTRLLLVAGANTLRDDYTPCPDFDLDTLEKLRVPVVLCGLGHYGAASVTQGMGRPTIRLLEAMIDRFPLISVRCDSSYEYVTRSAPHLRDKVLMTSCPVVYSVDGFFGNFEKKNVFDQLVVTVTDRSHLEQQLAVIQAVPKLFQAKKFVLALHQDYSNVQLLDFCKRNGYSVFRSNDYQDYIELYKETDLHIGNRLHAHLKCLSLGCPTFLLPFDLRQAYFSQSLDFPLIDRLPNPAFDEWDFHTSITRVIETRKEMDVFVKSVRSVLGETL